VRATLLVFILFVFACGEVESPFEETGEMNFEHETAWALDEVSGDMIQLS